METHYLVTILILAAICLAYFIFRPFARRKREARKDVPMDMKEPDTTPLPDEPDEVIILDPIHVNEPDSTILLYRTEGLLVFGAMRVSIDLIKDISINNASNFYIPCAYHILLMLKDGRVAHIPAGQDGEWANEALKQLREAVFTGKPE